MIRICKCERISTQDRNIEHTDAKFCPECGERFREEEPQITGICFQTEEMDHDEFEVMPLDEFRKLLRDG